MFTYKKDTVVGNMVPIDRTLEKGCFIYRYFFIYLNLKDMGLGDDYEQNYIFR